MESEEDVLLRKERKRIWDADYRKRNKEKVRQSSLEYKHRNKEKIKAKDAEYRALNHLRIKEYHKHTVEKYRDELHDYYIVEVICKSKGILKNVISINTIKENPQFIELKRLELENKRYIKSQKL